jgi:cell wall-associated NlpC family hydrolase
MSDILMQAQDYVGVPWVQDFGDDPVRGMDCYSFARYFVKCVGDIDIPRYKYAVHGCTNVSLEILKYLYRDFVKVEAGDRRPLDLILLRYEKQACHAAVYLGHNKMIHCDDPQSAIINLSEKLHLVAAEHRIEGYYRCR